MDSETIQYIINHYTQLFTDNERRALRYIHSITKPAGRKGDDLKSSIRLYLKADWLTDDPAVLDLLKDGDDAFKRNVAERLLKEHADNVFLNYCPICNKLARTPFAKQCRYCGHNWHEE